MAKLTPISNCYCFVLLIIFSEQTHKNSSFSPLPISCFSGHDLLETLINSELNITASASVSSVMHSTALQMWSLSLELWAAHTYLTVHHGVTRWGLGTAHFSTLYPQAVSGAMYRITNVAAEFPGWCCDPSVLKRSGRRAPETCEMINDARDGRELGLCALGKAARWPDSSLSVSKRELQQWRGQTLQQGLWR